MEEKDIDMKTPFRALIYYRLTEVDLLILFDSHGLYIKVSIESLGHVNCITRDRLNRTRFGKRSCTIEIWSM